MRTACANGKLDFVTFNLEVGASGTPHLQIMAKAAKPMRTTAWQTALGGRLANVVATKYPAHCLDYCQGFVPKTERATRKDGSQDASAPSFSGHSGFEEYGHQAQNGIRTSLGECVQAIKVGAKIVDLMEQYPGTVNGAYRMLTDLKEHQLDQDCKADVLDGFTNIVWLPFQQDVIDLVATIPDQRTLHWFHEPTGKVGKSRVTKYLACLGTAYCLDATKPADIFCGYNREPVVIFDIPRSKIEHMDHLYGVIEKFIDSLIFVGKYKSKAMPIHPPHVIVFSNDPLKLSITNDKTGVTHDTLSKDRWNIVNIATTYLKSHDNTVVAPKVARKRTKPES